MSEASDLFWDVFQGGGARAIDCICGREHFTRKPADWDSEEELLAIMNRECAMPNRVIGTDDDSVGYMTLNGVVICYGCPCGSAAKYESFLLNERGRIVDYFRKDLERKTAELKTSNEAFQSLLRANPSPGKEAQ